MSAVEIDAVSCIAVGYAFRRSILQLEATLGAHFSPVFSALLGQGFAILFPIFLHFNAIVIGASVN
jgi:hypothetical protein